MFEHYIGLPSSRFMHWFELQVACSSTPSESTQHSKPSLEGGRLPEPGRSGLIEPTQHSLPIKSKQYAWLN